MSTKAMVGGYSKRASGAPFSKQQLPSIDAPSWKRALASRLTAWFSAHARKLPWRETRDAYRIWVSETMLQQTQVATVIPYYERFLQAFPDIRSLAAADEHEVLRHWEGLGYYRRARQLHRAAQIIVAEHGGEFPQEFAVAIGLPGIGRYTAGAVLSLAFNQRLPILEANTLRVYSRLLAYRADPRSTAGQKRLWEAAESWVPARQPGTFNQALMELGSRICTIRNPLCEKCPVAQLCPTRALKLQASIPPPAARPKIDEVQEALVVIARGQQVLLVRRQGAERWAGMWDFPRFELDAAPGRTPARLAARVAKLLRIRIGKAKRFATLKHGVTRFRITLHCCSADAIGEVDSVRGAGRQVRASAEIGGPEIRWVSPAELSQYALSVTGRRVARLVEQQAAAQLQRTTAVQRVKS